MMKHIFTVSVIQKSGRPGAKPSDLFLNGAKKVNVPSKYCAFEDKENYEGLGAEIIKNLPTRGKNKMRDRNYIFSIWVKDLVKT